MIRSRTTAKQPHPATALHRCKTATPHYTAQSAKTAPRHKPKKLASTLTPLQNNWSPLQKELLRHAYSEHYGEADLKDLSEPTAMHPWMDSF